MFIHNITRALSCHSCSKQIVTRWKSRLNNERDNGLNKSLFKRLRIFTVFLRVLFYDRVRLHWTTLHNKQTVNDNTVDSKIKIRDTNKQICMRKINSDFRSMCIEMSRSSYIWNFHFSCEKFSFELRRASSPYNALSHSMSWSCQKGRFECLLFCAIKLAFYFLPNNQSCHIDACIMQWPNVELIADREKNLDIAIYRVTWFQLISVMKLWWLFSRPPCDRRRFFLHRSPSKLRI